MLSFFIADRSVPARSVQEDGRALLHRQGQGPSRPRGAPEDGHVPRSHRRAQVS